MSSKVGLANNRDRIKSISTIDDVASSFLHDSDDEENHQNGQQLSQNDNPNLAYPLGRNRLALILFSSKVVFKTCPNCKRIGEQFRLTYKFQGGERKLIKAILDGHGFKEVHPHSSEFNLIWTGNNIKTYMFRSLREFQKINHFPRSCELTRKDRLYKNVQRMQHERGIKSYQIVPTTFVMPYEIDDFYSTFYREKGYWIVKPVASSRGRGIFLINHPDQVPLDDNLVVSKYISNPLLIEGYKFDLRLYVAVTSFDPLVVYLYEEGLTRFATIKYDKNLKNLKNTWIHLTNYSVNKKNEKYVRCNDPDVDDYGNKWSLSAMLRYLAREGKDTFTLMMQIEELIIKTLMAVESPLASASRMFIPHRGNCFEVYGFDILIDDELKPWVLEVNLSPSLDCDAVLDLKIKSNMISDLLSLSGVYCQTPLSNRARFLQRNDSTLSSYRSRPASASSQSRLSLNNPHPNNGRQSDLRPSTSSKSRQSSASLSRTKSETLKFEGLSQNEASIFKLINEENTRAGNFVRIFPTPDTWEFFSQYLETRTTSYNLLLHQKLFPKRWLQGGAKKTSVSRAKLLQSSYSIYKQTNNQNLLTSDTGACLDEALKRHKLYMRKLNDVHKIDALTYEYALQRFVPNAEPLEKMLSHHHNVHHVHDQSENVDNHSDHSSVAAVTSKPPLNGHGFFTIQPTTSRSAASSGSTAKTILNGAATKRQPSSVPPTSAAASNVQHTKNEAEYSFDTVLKLLDDGYYMSRIQVRLAFALYLSKIQMRLMVESEMKDESNTQQMDLVLRFMKKAAVNLSQPFKVYVPSKRLPVNEQKRMLSKQLQDFLQIYSKDTDHIRTEQQTELEIEKLKNHKRLFVENALMALLNSSNEIQLEEIMSVYMRNSKDSSAFLGKTIKKDDNLRKLKIVLKNNARDLEKTFRQTHRTRSVSTDGGSSAASSASSSKASSRSSSGYSIKDRSQSIIDDDDSTTSEREIKIKKDFNEIAQKHNHNQDIDSQTRLGSAQSVQTNFSTSTQVPNIGTSPTTATTQNPPIATINAMTVKKHLTKRPNKSAASLRNSRPTSTIYLKSHHQSPPQLTTTTNKPLVFHHARTSHIRRSTSGVRLNSPKRPQIQPKEPPTPVTTVVEKQTNLKVVDHHHHHHHHQIDDDNDDNTNWSLKLRNLVEKQQKRNYSATSAKLVLQPATQTQHRHRQKHQQHKPHIDLNEEIKRIFISSSSNDQPHDDGYQL